MTCDADSSIWGVTAASSWIAAGAIGEVPTGVRPGDWVDSQCCQPIHVKTASTSPIARLHNKRRVRAPS